MPCWGIDTILPARSSQADAVSTAALKGIAAAIVNIALALSTGASLPGRASLGGALALVLYPTGLSLVCFIVGSATWGAARTGAYFSEQLRLSSAGRRRRFW